MCLSEIWYIRNHSHFMGNKMIHHGILGYLIHRKTIWKEARASQSLRHLWATPRGPTHRGSRDRISPLVVTTKWHCEKPRKVVCLRMTFGTPWAVERLPSFSMRLHQHGKKWAHEYQRRFHQSLCLGTSAILIAIEQANKPRDHECTQGQTGLESNLCYWLRFKCQSYILVVESGLPHPCFGRRSVGRFNLDGVRS